MSNGISNNYNQQVNTQPPVYMSSQVGRAYTQPMGILPPQFAQQQAPCQTGGLLGQLANLYQQTMMISRMAQAQYSQDRSSGLGILSGAANFGNIASQAFNGMMMEQQYPQMGQLMGRGIGFQQLGQLAQSFMLNKGESLLAGELGKQLGVTLPNLSANSVFNAGAELLGFGSPAGATGLASSSLEAGGMKALESGIGANASKFLGGVGAAYSAFDLLKNWGKNDPISGAVQGATTGAYIGSVVPGIGTLIGGAVGGLIGLASGLFGGSGKSKEQKLRDSFRDNLEQLGVLDGNHCVNLADGSKYNCGYDGGHKYTNLDGTQRGAFEIDFKNPLASQVIGWANPVIDALTGGDPMLKVAFVGYVTNAATSNATTLEEARQNVLSIFSNMKVGMQDVVGALTSMTQQGKLPKSTYDAYINGLQTLGRPASSDKLLESPPKAEQINGKAIR